MKKNIKSTKVDKKPPSSKIKDVIHDKDFDHAVAVEKKALKIAEKKSGPKHPSVALVLNNLAAIYYEYAKSTEAEPLFKRALAIQEKALGKDHLEVAKTLNNLAVVYEDIGQFSDAEMHWKRALEIHKKALGPDHLDVAFILDNLAFLYDVHGKMAKAEPLFKRSLAILEKALGPDHPDVANALENLASRYATQKKNYAKAETLYERALEIRIEDLSFIISTLQELTNLYKVQGKHSKAKPLKKYLNAIADINNDRHKKLEKIKR